MAEWEIQKTVGQCSGTGKKFEVGQEYYSALVLSENGFERLDFSLEYWQENKPQVYCFWKTKMLSPDQKKKKLFIDDDMLMAFFDRLEQETEDEKINFRFVLTLILMRKRKLKYESSRNDGDHEVWNMKVTGQDRQVEVVNPELTEDQIAELSEQMGEILQVDL
ncbi:MAG: hypothetical protein JW912_07335 [Sedimentisphaerales bacterium]|nr:hypothetical protein [Sedimentisphaerales bacterium]